MSARATDDLGATAVSSPVHIRILESGPALRPGYLRWEVYDNIPGFLVSDLTNHSSFPDHPTAVALLSAFETPAQYGENYGARLSGFLLPPVTGDYVFYLSSDDQGVLFLSTDEQPAHTAEIAREPAWSPPRNWTGPAAGREHNENISIPIRLEAGRRYYVEALMKEAGGGDQLGVAWQLPGEPEPANGSPPISGEFLATWADGTPEPRELHVVGIYEGLAGTPGAGGDQARAAVVVNRPGKRVTLFLSSYNPVLWHVTVSEGSLVEKVILGGYHGQAVEGLPPGVEVVAAYYEGGVSDYLWIGYAIDSGQFLRSVPRLHEKTGLEIASFQGRYRPLPATPFVVDTVQQDPRLRSDYPQPIPPSELPILNFSLTFWNESGPPAVTHKTYTLTGPDDNTRWLLPGVRIVADTSQRYFYGTRWQSVLRVDSLAGATQEMQVGPGVPELSWPMGVAYDSQRRRILVVSLGGDGYLYAYAPESGRWSLVANMDNRDFECLVYHPPQDMLYGLKVHHADGEKPVLYRLDAAGKFQGEISLPLLPYDVGPSGYHAELASAGDYLVLLLAPQSWPPHGPATHDSRMYLINPRSGQSRLAYRRVGPTENEPVNGAIVSAGDTDRLVAEASDPDSSVESVEFFANGQSLGMGVRASEKSPFQLLWTWPAPGSHRLSAKATDGEGASAGEKAMGAQLNN